MNICKQVGMTLISVPFWWDKNEASLIATIRSIRQDLAQMLPDSTASIIPEHMPMEHSNRKETYAPLVFTPYKSSIDPTSWYLIL
jgi:hypothetical protein